MRTFLELENSWRDDRSYHETVIRLFTAALAESPFHLSICTSKKEAFGPAAVWFWKLLFDELADGAKLLVVGDNTDGTALFTDLAKGLGKEFLVRGVFPVKGAGKWQASLWPPTRKLKKNSFDVVFLDGRKYTPVVDEGESPPVMTPEEFAALTNGVVADLDRYLPVVKMGGYLAISRACQRFKLPSDVETGSAVANAVVDDRLPPWADIAGWDFLATVGDLRIWRRLEANR